MNDAVDRLIVEREAMDRGLPGGMVLSISAHAFLVVGVFLAALLGPKEPLLKVQDGFAVALPPGGGGSPAAQAPAAPRPVPPRPETTQPPKPEPPPKIVKPPKEEKRSGLPDIDAKKTKPRTKPDRTPAPASTGGTGASSEAQGLSFAPGGPGAPGGTDLNGDWYLAGVQGKIWSLWSQQVRAGTWQPFTVSFTINADGSVSDVKVVQSSGVFTLDLAAQRAISSAGPFGPLPKTYGTDHFTIQALFKPTS
jgi:TonB family protein